MRQTFDNPGRAKIQQLLAAIGSKTPDDSRNIDAPIYDWHLPHFFTNQQMKKVNDFASKVVALIGEKFRALCPRCSEVALTSISEHFAGQFLGQEPTGTPREVTNYYLHFSQSQRFDKLAAPSQVEGEEPCGFISIPPQTAVIWTKQLLGDTEPKETNARSLSELETSLLFDIALHIIDALTAAGEKCSFRPASNVMLDHLPLVLKGTEEFCKISLQVKKAGSETASEAHILILCEKLAQAIGESAQTNGKLSPKDAARAIQDHIETIPVTVTAQLARVPVTFEQILNLSPGDILLLDKKMDEPALLFAAGRTVCRGRCAKSAGNYALVITETLF